MLPPPTIVQRPGGEAAFWALFLKKRGAIERNTAANWSQDNGIIQVTTDANTE